MDNLSLPLLVMSSVLAAIAIGTLGLALARGWLREEAFAAAPPRKVHLGLEDLAGALCIQIVGMVVAQSILAHLGLLSSGPRDSWAEAGRALWSQGLVQVPVVGFMLVRTWRQPHGWRELGLVPRRPRWEALVGVSGLVAALGLTLTTLDVTAVLSQWLVEPPPKVGHEMLTAMRAARSAGALATLCISAIVVAPLLEESIFRGLFQTALREVEGAAQRAWCVILVSAALFAMVHVGSPWQVFPGLFVLGIVLGWLYERTGSLWPGILVHAGFNAFNVAQALHWGLR